LNPGGCGGPELGESSGCEDGPGAIIGRSPSRRITKKATKEVPTRRRKTRRRETLW